MKLYFRNKLENKDFEREVSDSFDSINAFFFAKWAKVNNREAQTFEDWFKISRAYPENQVYDCPNFYAEITL